MQGGSSSTDPCARFFENPHIRTREGSLRRYPGRDQERACTPSTEPYRCLAHFRRDAPSTLVVPTVSNRARPHLRASTLSTASMACGATCTTRRRESHRLLVAETWTLVALVEVSHLVKQYRRGGGLFRTGTMVTAVDD